MTTSDESKDWAAEMVREHYNPPPETPRDAMWEAIEARISQAGPSVVAGEITPRAHRGSSWLSRPVWLAVAASTVLAVGVGIGRVSAGGEVAGDPGSRTVLEGEAARGSTRVSAARLVAVEHLYRTEPLVALVKADAARGAVGDEVASWARELLAETRFLMDAELEMEPEVVHLLRDLELVLMQTVLVAGGGVDTDRLDEELSLLREGLDERNVLPRIQAVMPVPGMAGT